MLTPMGIQSLGYRTDLKVRQLAGLEITEHESHIIVRSKHNPGFWWGNFVLIPSKQSSIDLENCIGLFRDAFPDTNYIAIGIDSTEASGNLTLNLNREDLHVGVYSVLAANALIEPTSVDGNTIMLPPESDHDWSSATELQVAVSQEEGLYSVDHDSFLLRSTAEARSLCDKRQGVYFGAFVDGQLC